MIYQYHVPCSARDLSAAGVNIAHRFGQSWMTVAEAAPSPMHLAGLLLQVRRREEAHWGLRAASGGLERETSPSSESLDGSLGRQGGVGSLICRRMQDAAAGIQRGSSPGRIVPGSRAGVWLAVQSLNLRMW